jgi:hypothetical protein
MKKIILLLSVAFFFMSAGPHEDQYYHIIKIKGKILNVTTGESLSPGDKINASDQLEFMDQYSQAIVMGDKTGKFTITMPEGDIFGESKLLAMAETAASPIEGRSQLITRAGGEQTVDDLNNLFGNESFYIIGERLDINMDPDNYSLSKENYITLEFSLNEEHISKKLKSNNQTLYINKMALIGENEPDTISNVSVYQYDMSSRTINKITEMNMVFVDEDVLINEMNMIKKLLIEQEKSRKDIINYLAKYFVDIYGKTDHGQLFSFIRERIYPE